MLVLRAQQEMTNLNQLKTPLFKMQIKVVVYRTIYMVQR